MGDINGAIIIAPIIAGALFAMRPNVAIAVASPNMKKKLKDGMEERDIVDNKSSAGSLSS